MFDLGRLNPETTHLDLIVRASLEQHKPVIAPTDQITCCVETAEACRLEGPLGCVGLLEVTAGQARAPKEQLAGRFEWNLCVAGTKNVSLGVVGRCPDRGISLRGGAVMIKSHDAGLRRAVQVEHPVASRVLLNEVEGTLLAHQSEHLQRGDLQRNGQSRHRRRGIDRMCNSEATHEFHHASGGGHVLVPPDHQRRPYAEGDKDLQHEDVKADRTEL